MITNKILMTFLMLAIFSSCATSSHSNMGAQSRSVASKCLAKFPAEQDYEDMFVSVLSEFSKAHPSKDPKNPTKVITVGAVTPDDDGNCHRLISIDGNSLGADPEVNYKAFMATKLRDYVKSNDDLTTFAGQFNDALKLSGAYYVDQCFMSDPISLQHNDNLDQYAGAIWGNAHNASACGP